MWFLLTSYVDAEVTFFSDISTMHEILCKDPVELSVEMMHVYQNWLTELRFYFISHSTIFELLICSQSQG